MATWHLRVLLAVLLIAGVSKNAHGQSKTIDDAPSPTQTSSLGQALRNPDQHPVHILYLHGIAEQKAGDSWNFQRRLCGSLKGCKLSKNPVPVKRDYADSGEFADNTLPPDFKYMGSPVWTGKEDWNASKPFVDHYVLSRSDGGPVVVDEINWWPLVFPLKCRKIMEGEAYLAGPNKDLLRLCSGQVNAKVQPNPYAFITPEDADKLESLPAKGALFNRGVKTALLDWGFSDAMMAAGPGPMRQLLREAMRQLFVKSARFNANATATNDGMERLKHDTPGREFVVVSHSLGSFLVFSTLTDRVTAQRCVALESAPTQKPESDAAGAKSEMEDRAACYILARTSILYFFANQVPLLQLANIVGPRTTAQSGEAEALNEQIAKWKEMRKKFGEIHLTAFSDPSDLLTWQFPKVGDTEIENCYVRNTFWRWIIAPPGRAHNNYAKNREVLRIMLHPETYGAHACSSPQ